MLLNSLIDQLESLKAERSGLEIQLAKANLASALVNVSEQAPSQEVGTLHA